MAYVNIAKQKFDTIMIKSVVFNVKYIKAVPFVVVDKNDEQYIQTMIEGWCWDFVCKKLNVPNKQTYLNLVKAAGNYAYKIWASVFSSSFRQVVRHRFSSYETNRWLEDPTFIVPKKIKAYTTTGQVSCIPYKYEFTSNNDDDLKTYEAFVKDMANYVEDQITNIAKQLKAKGEQFSKNVAIDDNPYYKVEIIALRSVLQLDRILLIVKYNVTKKLNELVKICSSLAKIDQDKLLEIIQGYFLDKISVDITDTRNKAPIHEIARQFAGEDILILPAAAQQGYTSSLANFVKLNMNCIDAKYDIFVCSGFKDWNSISRFVDEYAKYIRYIVSHIKIDAEKEFDFDEVISDVVRI